MKRNLVVQIVIILVAASILAVVANAFAGRTRKLILPGYYPHALRVPPREPTRVPPPPRTETAAPAPAATATLPAVTGTVAQSPAPGQPPLPVPTTSIGRPAGATPSAAATPAAGAPATPPKPRVDLSKFQPHPDRASVDISGEEAAALHAAGALFLDARRSSVFEAGHIAGARSFSVWEADIDDKVNALFEERSDPAEQNKPIVIYCSGGACEDSHMLAQKLWGIQFNNVYVYKDGFPDWQKRAGAVRTGANP